MDINQVSNTVNEYFLLLVYLLPVGLFWLWRISSRRKAGRQFQATYDKNVAEKRTEPPSLHPIIDGDLCIACNACAKACPEGEILGIINEKVVLIHPTKCIGHGACARSCPVDAITLVFGTEKRGVDIPEVDPSFESNTPGIFVAGELGGMGLIGNAIVQGAEAMETIEAKAKGISGNPYDVAIIGAGPAGLSASLYALDKKMKYVTIEQNALGGTVANYPRGKIVMTFPVKMPMIGKVRFRETTKEELIGFWNNVARKTGVKINLGERMTAVTKNGRGFVVKTTLGSYQASMVLMAIGRNGTPRKLGVPGEDQTKVVYRLADPAQYQGRHVLVVGGGDSALEAAITIADEPGTTTTISYRSGAFSRAKEKNQHKVAQSEKDGKLRVLFKSTVKEILKDKVIIDQEGTKIEIPNEAIIVSAGGLPPTGVLNSMGIEVVTKHGEV